MMWFPCLHATTLAGYGLRSGEKPMLARGNSLVFSLLSYRTTFFFNRALERAHDFSLRLGTHLSLLAPLGKQIWQTTIMHNS